jgi:predicted RNA-binding Zn-ribbon protein involved in translation (DUF1610 family)
MAREFLEKGEKMKRSKCPECGEELRRRARKCRSCGTQIIVCGECGKAYKKGEIRCDMCGKELKKTRAKKDTENRGESNFLPDDLVSVINSIKSEGVGFKIFGVLWWIFWATLCICFAISVAIGLFVGELFPDIAVSVISGNGIEEILALISNTPTRNLNIWTEFVKEVTRNDATFLHFLKFANYLVSALFLPMLTVTVFFIAVYVPLDIGEELYCGIAARNKEYNASDTIAVLERPTLIYNSRDSFCKTYAYFPFLERKRGRLATVISGLLYYAANLFCCLFGIAVFIVHAVLKILLRVIFTGSALSYIITLSAILAVVLYIIVVAGVIVCVKLVTKAIRKKQLKYWAV